jgi:hypothetical protein
VSARRSPLSEAGQTDVRGQADVDGAGLGEADRQHAVDLLRCALGVIQDRLSRRDMGEDLVGDAVVACVPEPMYALEVTSQGGESLGERKLN